MKKILILFMLVMLSVVSLLIFSGCSDNNYQNDQYDVGDGVLDASQNDIDDGNSAEEPQQSLFAFEGYAELLNRVYTTVNGRELRFDIFFPTEQVFERTPLVVGFHGGGWMAGHRSELTDGFAPIINELRANGYAFTTVEYRFASPPAVVFPAPFEDSIAFMNYIIENAAIYNIDADNIGVFGYSAGAHLAMLLAYATEFDIRYVINFAGPTKMYGDDPANYPAATMHMVENLFGGTYEDLPDLFRDGSPFFHVELRYYIQNSDYMRVSFANDWRVPLLLVHDRTDAVVPFSQAEIMHEKLTSIGIHSELLELRGVGHDINFNRQNMANRDEIIERIVNFIYKFTKNY